MTPARGIPSEPPDQGTSLPARGAPPALWAPWSPALQVDRGILPAVARHEPAHARRRRPKPPWSAIRSIDGRRLLGIALVVLLVVLLVALGSTVGRPKTRHAPTSESARGDAEALTVPTTVDSYAIQSIVATANWRIQNRGKPHDIEGWADHVSILPGETFHLYVSTTSPTFAVSVFRMGWYGGAEGALIYKTPPFKGSVQAPPTVLAKTNTVVTNWSPTATLTADGWPAGFYLLRLEGDNGVQRFIPITVRSISNQGRLVILSAITTWQAYNAWGGYDLYQSPKGITDFSHRSRAVSFDRPYSGDGSGEFLPNELPLISLAEKLGVPLGYATDIDLHSDPTLLDGAKALISLGHDEYWSPQMRQALTNARDSGMNIAFLGANAIFRKIRLESTRYGTNRLEVCYKRANEDPQTGISNADVTVDWREPPVSKPESVLTGVFYESNPVTADMVVVDPGNWLFEGLGLKAGARIPGLVGHEYDRVNPGAPTPRTIEVLSHSPLVCRGVRSFSDAAYYTTTSGAGVFATGTNLWIPSLDTSPSQDKLTQRFVVGATSRLLEVFATGPAGFSHPALDNLSAMHEYVGDPIAAGSRSSGS
jgi:hypothetical protein